jgi:REJ domain
VLVYHGVQSENTPRCASQTTTACVGDYDTTASQFQAQLDYISATGLASDVMTVRQALQDAGSQTQPPQAGTVKITPTQPTTNATVTATATGFTGPQGRRAGVYLRMEGRRRRDGDRDIRGRDRDVRSSLPGHGDHGDSISGAVSADDGQGGTSPAVSDTVTVANTPPTAGSVTITPAAPAPGTTLTATSSGFSDADGDPLTYQYDWVSNGKQISGPTGAALSGSSVQAGVTITVQVRATDGQGGTSAAVSATVNVSTPPVDKVPPTIVIDSPKAQPYVLGATFTVQFSCTDSSGISRCTATLSRPGSATQAVSPAKTSNSQRPAATPSASPPSTGAPIPRRRR